MAKALKKDDAGYVVGRRPPQDLTPEAKEQLDRGHKSKAMDELVEKAEKGKVTFQLNKEYILRILSSPPHKKKRK